MAKAYYIPDGPANLQPLFPVNFEEIAEYYVELTDNLDNVIATSTLNQICGCEDDEDQKRIHFLNALGAIDAINFKLVNEDHETKSDTYEKPTSIPLVKTQHGLNRFNIKSNDLFRAISIQYHEPQMDWIDELLDAPLAWLEWPGGQGQSATFIPIVILDGKSNKIKQNDRYAYEKEIEFKMSHDKFTIRN